MTARRAPARRPAAAARWQEAERLAAGQHGVLTRAQAAACGLTARMMEYAIGPGGRWHRLLPGIYLARDGEPGQDQRLMAAQLYAGDGAIITGLAALRRHGLPAGEPAADVTVTDVLVPYARRRVSPGIVQVHRTTRMPGRWLADGPLRYALPARAVADAARGPRQPRDAGVIAAAAVGRGLCTPAELAAELAEGPRRNTAGLRAALAGLAARGPAGNPGASPAGGPGSRPAGGPAGQAAMAAGSPAGQAGGPARQ